ncbi:PHP domain-containing protein [Candidatus Woesearchaeota archaeon]|nr:MAG: PHP domain-containing protein [Candidatus Woesearchaeota archaeon]
MERDVLRYDLHMHSKYSKDSFNEPKLMILQAVRMGLNGIAVTDHGSIKGGLKACEELRKLKSRGRVPDDFEVVAGEEVMTDAGEVLAYYIQDEIPKVPLEEALDRIKEQNGIASIAHPYSRGVIRKAFTADIEKVLKKHKLDALEGFNARIVLDGGNRKAQQLATKHNLAMTAGSDAHFLSEIGRGYVEFKELPGGLREAVKKKATIPKGSNRLAFFYRSITLANVLRKKI